MSGGAPGVPVPMKRTPPPEARASLRSSVAVARRSANSERIGGTRRGIGGSAAVARLPDTWRGCWQVGGSPAGADFRQLQLQYLAVGIGHRHLAGRRRVGRATLDRQAAHRPHAPSGRSPPAPAPASASVRLGAATRLADRRPHGRATIARSGPTAAAPRGLCRRGPAAEADRRRACPTGLRRARRQVGCAGTRSPRSAAHSDRSAGLPRQGLRSPDGAGRDR